MKTGYTESAGYCLLATAQREFPNLGPAGGAGKRRIMTVVLNTVSMEARANDVDEVGAGVGHDVRPVECASMHHRVCVAHHLVHDAAIRDRSDDLRSVADGTTSTPTTVCPSARRRGTSVRPSHPEEPVTTIRLGGRLMRGLQVTSVSSAQLSSAQLSSAQLSSAQLSSAQLSSAQLSSAPRRRRRPSASMIPHPKAAMVPARDPSFGDRPDRQAEETRCNPAGCRTAPSSGAASSAWACPHRRPRPRPRLRHPHRRPTAAHPWSTGRPFRRPCREQVPRPADGRTPGPRP